MIKRVKIVFTIIATLIGAGFASGQELNIFFYSYGIKGMLGLVVCSILMGVIIYKGFNITNKLNLNSYEDFIKCFTKGNNREKYLNLSFIISIIVNIFLIVSFFIMIAGFGAYFSQELNVNAYFGSGIITIFCLITFMLNSNFIVKINSFLVPILILFILIIGIINFTTIDIDNVIHKLSHINKHGWLLSSILYSSYNCIFLIPVIITLRKYLNNKKDAIVSAVISSVVIFLLSITICLIISRIDSNINQFQMPALYAVGNYFENFKIIYSFIILVSIYTTAISIGMVVLKNFSKNYKKSVICMCITGFIVSGIGFSNLVAYIYPIFGYLGLLQIACILFK